MGKSEVLSTVLSVTKTHSTLPANPVIIFGGAEVVEKYKRKLEREMEVYNRRMETLSSPYVLRSRHISGDYQYENRYVYQKVWDDDEGRIREVYVGKTVPEDENVPEGGFPKPPEDPLEGFVFTVMGSDVICTQEMFNRFHQLFIGHNILMSNGISMTGGEISV